MGQMGETKTWSDQPDEVASARVLGGFQAEIGEGKHNQCAYVELRVRIDTRPDSHGVETTCYYVSIGTLFGSETVRCNSPVVVLLVLCNLGSRKLPLGAEFMENARC